MKYLLLTDGYHGLQYIIQLTKTNNTKYIGKSMFIRGIAPKKWYKDNNDEMKYNKKEWILDKTYLSMDEILIDYPELMMI